MSVDSAPPPPPNSRAARRAAFLAVATETFVEFGYERTSLDDIVARAGGSKSTIYANYGNKEGLFRAILQDRVDMVIGEARQEDAAPDVSDQSIRARLTRYGSGLIRGLCHPSNDVVWRLLLSSTWQFPDIAEQHYKNGPKVAVSDVQAILQKALDKDEIRPVDPRRGAEIFLGSMRHYDVLIGRLLGIAKPPPEDEQKAIVRDAVAIFLDGLETKA
ncbi:MAG: TetR/AcrR family transcriptional regulator [Pseudomonadota bacterium]